MKLRFSKKKKVVPFRAKLGGMFRQGMHPMRDWMIGLSAASIVFVTGATLIAYDFRIQFVLPPEVTDTNEITISYSERDVAYYADRFRTKDARFNELRADIVAVPDTQPVEPPPEIQDDPLADEGSTEYTTPELFP